MDPQATHDPSALAPTPQALRFDRAPNQFIDVGHSKVPYQRIGQGPDVLFVHGWPLFSATFRDLAPLLADDFTCHLIDLPGTGFSKWDHNSQIGLVEHGATVAHVADELGLDHYGMLAHDSGAVVARLAAAKHGKRVAGLVMGNTEIPGHQPKLVELYSMLARVPGGDRLLPLLVRSRAVRRSALGYKGCFHDLAFLDGAFHKYAIEPLLRAESANGQMQLLKNLHWKVIGGLSKVHAEITAPVQLVWGADDPFFPLDKARKMLDQFPGGAEVREIRPGKLFAHEEFPAQFALHARTFLLKAFA